MSYIEEVIIPDIIDIIISKQGIKRKSDEEFQKMLDKIEKELAEEWKNNDFNRIREIIAKHDNELLDYFDFSNIYTDTKTGNNAIRFVNPKTNIGYKCIMINWYELRVVTHKDGILKSYIWELDDK